MVQMTVGDRECSWSGSKGQEFSRCKSVIGTVRDPVRKANASRYEMGERGGPSEPIWYPLYQQKTCFARAIPIACEISCWCMKEFSCKVRKKARNLQQHSNSGCKVWRTLSQKWRKIKVSIDCPIERISIGKSIEKMQNRTLDNSRPAAIQNKNGRQKTVSETNAYKNP